MQSRLRHKRRESGHWRGTLTDRKRRRKKLRGPRNMMRIDSSNSSRLWAEIFSKKRRKCLKRRSR